MDTQIPTSVVLDVLINSAPPHEVTLAWVIANLRDRSFGILLLVLAMVGLLPGASLIVAIVLLWPAVQMMMARTVPAFPARIMQRHVRTAQFA